MKTAISFLCSCLSLCAGIPSPAWVESASESHHASVYPSTTVYVSLVGDNSDGTTWAKAYTTISNAMARSVQGSVIEIEGGVYNALLNNGTGARAKEFFIYGSDKAGHNSPVYQRGVVTLNPPTNGAFATMANLKFIGTNDVLALDSVQLNGSWNFIGCDFGPYYGTNNNPKSFIKGYNNFYRCNFNYAAIHQSLQTTASSITTNRFEYCAFWEGSGNIRTLSYDQWTFINCSVIGAETFRNTAWAQSSVNSTLLFTNCMIAGCAAATGCSNGIAQNCVYWTGSFDPTTQTNFFSLPKGTTAESSCVSNSPAAFMFPQNKVGRMFLRIDDQSNASNAWYSAQVLNSIGFLNFMCEGHSTNNPFSSNSIYYCRNLVDNGNDVGCHTGTHSNDKVTNVLFMSCSGTSPTLTISTTTAGDSTNWTGSLTILTNGVAATNLDLTVYATIREVTNALHGKALGGGTISCTITNISGSAHSPSMLSLVLLNQTALDISTVKPLPYDQIAFCASEITEPVADLQAYIRTGSDRNGLHSLLPAATGGTPSASYTCKVLATPYSSGSQWAFNAATNIPAMVGGCISGGSIYGLTWTGDMLGFPTTVNRFAIDNLTQSDSRTTKALFAQCVSSPSWQIILNHGVMNFGSGTVQDMKDLCLSHHLGNVTIASAIESITNNADWTSGRATNQWVGDVNTLKVKGSPGPYAAWINTGAYVTNELDVIGNKVNRRGGIDIGAFELQ